jgi:mono/diheme cytochrome c family protein
MKTTEILCFALLLFFFIACKDSNQKSNNNNNNVMNNHEINSMQADSSEKKLQTRPVSAKTGVGPIDHKVKLGDQIDEAMAKSGERLFNNKCSGCHRIHDNAQGPALGGVLQKRSPQWVMNMILNPGGMIEKNQQVQAMKAHYKIDMVNRNLSKKEARDVVEFLRNY